MSAKDPFSPEELAKMDMRPGPITYAPGTTPNLPTALARAQAAFKPIGRDKTVTVRTKAGGTYSFSYAPLEAILRAVQPALSKEGLALTQEVVAKESKQYLKTTIYLGAESLSNSVEILVGDSGPQAYGSALTYARRYGITLLLCVCADDDDDANAAEGNETHETAFPADVLTPEKRTVLLPKFATAIDKGDVAALRKLVDSTNEGEQKGVWSFLSMKQKKAARELLQSKSPAAEYAERIREALVVGVDERIGELHSEMNQDTAIALEVSTLLSASELERVNAAVDRLR